MNTDPIADYLTRIRNASQARHRIVEIPASRIKEKMTQVLQDNGYIKQYKVDQQARIQGVITIWLKYNPSTKTSAITKLTRISKPGLRKYAKADALPSVINGLGIAILSTSQGILSDKEARKAKIGGEVLCYIY